jgi:hypothetical protein
MCNRFYIGQPVPPEKFVGRRSELTTAFAHIHNRGHLAIYGSPGMGKSSLLNYIQSPETWQQRRMDASQALIVYLNCTDINPFTSSAFWREILNLLKEKTEEDEELQFDIDEILEEEIVEKDDIRQILKEIGQRNKFLLLLLDDYDHALRVNEPHYNESDMFTFLSEFRNLAVHSQASHYLATVVTTFRRLNELGPNVPPGGSPWYNHYLFQLLKPFSAAEVQNHFLTEGNPFFMSISDFPNKEGLLSITGNYPILLQHLGHLLLSRNDQSNNPLDFQTFQQKFENATRHIFDDIWSNSTKEEQDLLMLIALSNLNNGVLQNNHYYIDDLEQVFSQKTRDLLDLQERGVINQRESQGSVKYAFTTSLIEPLIVQKIYANTEIERREKWHNLLSRQQIQGVENLIRSISQNDAINIIWQMIQTISRINS